MTEHKTLAAALAAFQAEVPKMSKDETAKVKGQTQDGRSYDRSYDYAGLDQFVEIVEPVLGKHGLSVTSAPTWEEGRFVLVVTLLHENGDQRSGYWPLPDPATRGVGPQDIGSAMTYGRRYIGWGLTGTFPGGIDDDGQQAQASARESWDNAQPRQEGRAAQERARQEQPAAPEKIEWTDEKIAEYHTKISGSGVTLAVKGYDWLAKEGVHERKIPVAGGGGDELTATQILAFRLADLAAQPDVDLSELAIIRANAEDRGLLNVSVSDDTTLGEELSLARDTLVKADVAQAKADTPEPDAE